MLLTGLTNEMKVQIEKTKAELAKRRRIRMSISFRTGDVIYADFSNGIGSQQKGKRYAVIVSNNIGNNMSSTVQVLPATTKRNGSNLPTHAHFSKGECGLTQDTVFLAEQTVTINKFQIIRIVDHMTDNQLKRIAKALLFAIPITVNAVSDTVDTPQFSRLQKA